MLPVQKFSSTDLVASASATRGTGPPTVVGRAVVIEITPSRSSTAEGR
jgi:hypothetical protein